MFFSCWYNYVLSRGFFSVEYGSDIMFVFSFNEYCAVCNRELQILYVPFNQRVFNQECYCVTDYGGSCCLWSAVVQVVVGSRCTAVVQMIGGSHCAIVGSRCTSGCG